MPGSRRRIGPSGGPKGQRPLRETEFSHFYSLKIGLSWLVKIRRLERFNKEDI